MPVRNRHAVSLRFPGEGSSAQGESGPKPRPKGIGDGEQVNIPVPPLAYCSTEGRGRRDRPPIGWWFKCVGRRRGKIPASILRHNDEGRKLHKAIGSNLQEKLRDNVSGARTANGHT